MADEKKRIKKLKLGDGSIYYLYDMDAARGADLENYLELSGGTITGDVNVDAVLKAKQLTVTQLDDRNLAVTNVLTQGVNGAIEKRAADKLLEDIGGISYSMDDSTGVLSFKYGKQ